MKIKITLSYFCRAFLGILLFISFASEVRAQGPGTFSKPGFSMNYQYTGTSWLHQSNSTFSYNTAGKVLEEVKQNPQTNQHTYKDLYTYDAQGNLKRHYTYQWQNGIWQFFWGYRDSLIYTPANKIASLTTVFWINNQWENYTRYDYTYNANNLLTEEIFSDWDAQTNSWQPLQKYEIAYDANGLIFQKQQSNYQTGSWSLVRTETYNGWYIPNVLPISYNTTITGSLYPRRNTITLGANGGHTNLYEYFYTFGNVWRNTSRQTETRDIRGNITNLLRETFNTTTNAWQNQSEHQNIYTYNNLFDITEWVIRHPDPGPQNGQPPKDRFKYVYSNFQYFNHALGTSETQQTELALNVYPNPATDKIQITLAENKPQALTATISDITGKIWQSQTFKAGEAASLNIEALPKGIYLMQLQTETGFTVKRIVKQ